MFRFLPRTDRSVVPIVVLVGCLAAATAALAAASAALGNAIG